MRILAITLNYPAPGFETAASFNRQQFRALAQKHELRVIAPVLWTDRLRTWKSMIGPRELERDGIRAYHPTYWYTPKVLGIHYGRFFLASVRKKAGEVLRQFTPDIILSCWAHPDGWAAIRIARAAGVPVVIKVIGSDILGITKDPRRRQVVAEALCEADGVVAVSQDLARNVIALGVLPQRVHVVSEGLDRDLFGPGDKHQARLGLGLPLDGKMLLFVGSLLEGKGALLLIEACARLRQRGVEFRCRLVGTGRHAGKVRSSINRHGLDGCMSMVGVIPHAQLPNWYRACDLVVLPSYSEGIPNVLREAMACGRPYVATRVGGIPEITEPPSGRLILPGDVEQLTDALAASLADPPHVDPKHANKINISWEESAHLLAERLREVVETGQAVKPVSSTIRSADKAS